MRERAQHKPSPCKVLGLGDKKLLEPYLRAITTLGYSPTEDFDADIIVAIDPSDDDLKRLREDPSARFVPVVVVREREGGWPDGADLVVKSTASPQFVAAQVRALRKRILIERSVSPLTGLPGAFSTEMEIASRFDSGAVFHVSYIDINNFKPFNDAYGFEKGDLIIQALSRAIMDGLSRFDIADSFCGHIGGDDFVVLSGHEPDPVMRWLALEFDRFVRAFYTETDRSRGGIVSFDREGKRKKFPLMSISIGSLRCGTEARTSERMSRQLTSLKKKAKSEAACTEGSVFLTSNGSETETGAEFLLGSLIVDDSIPASCRRAVIEAAGELHLEGTVGCLRLMLTQSPDDKLRKSAAYSLGRIADRESIGELTMALNDTSAHVRMRAAEALGEMGDGSALEPLLEAASDASKYVRCAALTSIGRLGIHSAMPHLVRATRDRSVDVRMSAVKAMGALGGATAYPELVRCLKEGPVSVTKAAAEALGYIPDARCVNALCQVLESHDSECIWRAAYSIYLIVKSGLVQVDRGHVANLLSNHLHSKNGYVLRACAMALGVLGHLKAVGPVVALLRDPRDYVRSAAAVALGKIGDKRALGPLRLAMKDGRATVKRNAAWALGELGVPEALETLRISLKDRFESVREMAAMSICRLVEKNSNQK